MYLQEKYEITADWGFSNTDLFSWGSLVLVTLWALRDSEHLMNHRRDECFSPVTNCKSSTWAALWLVSVPVHGFWNAESLMLVDDLDRDPSLKLVCCMWWCPFSCRHTDAVWMWGKLSVFQQKTFHQLSCLCFQGSSSKGNKDVRGGRSVQVKRRGRMEREEELTDRLQELVTNNLFVGFS